MLRLLLIVALALTSFFAVACGGGGDDDANAEGNGDGSETADAGPTATPTPQLLPTAPPATDEDQIVVVDSGENIYQPTLAEFRQLPTVKIDAGGEKEGVSLAELANHVSAPEGAIVNLQGYRMDGRMHQFVREPLADIGEGSVLVLDENGRLQFYSSTLDESQWLVHVISISFQ